MPWPVVAALPAPGGIQAAAMPRAGQPAAAQRNVGSDAAAVRRCAVPDAAPWPGAAAWPGDGMRGRRDAPWPVAPPDEPWQVVRLAERPALRPAPVVHPFRVLGRTR
ncbi:hypothetical protein [Bradyrhizobium sp. CSA207]|uniref:hypothetical protein n=1 Tax=Bradyrhizobium sp. CSA207 TaxID=2698826 RepID=UPI0023B1C2B6|nr:hypothetical protein [Bradyrhizobium sp. CSA207]